MRQVQARQRPDLRAGRRAGLVRRQAHALQSGRRDAQPRRRAAGAEPVLGLVPGAGAAHRRRAGGGADARGDRVRPRPRDASRRGHAAHEGDRPQQPEQSHRRRVLAGGDRGGGEARGRGEPVRRLRRVLRGADLRGASRVDRRPRPGDQGADPHDQHVLEGLRDDRLADRFRGRAARAHPRDDRHPEPGDVEPLVDRPVGRDRGARRSPR